MGKRFGRGALGAVLVAAGLAAAGCTITSYSGYGGDYDPYLRQQVFDRYGPGEDRQKARAMTAALEERRTALGRPYDAALFRDLGFTCPAPGACSMEVIKYDISHAELSYGPAVATTAATTLAEEGEAAYTPAPPTTNTVRYVDYYALRYTPQSVNVQVTSGGRALMP